MCSGDDEGGSVVCVVSVLACSSSQSASSAVTASFNPARLFLMSAMSTGLSIFRDVRDDS